MKTPSTANTGTAPSDGAESSTPADHPHGRSQTTASVKGNPSPRLPHERDESSDSGTRPPDGLMKKAHADAESDKVATDRSEEANTAYERLRDDKTKP